MSIRLIADAGSSKTDWSLLKEINSSPFRCSSCGLNPAHLSTEQLISNLQDVEALLPKEHIDSIYFFGAGCATPWLTERVKTALKQVFKEVSEIRVDSDLLGAAKALLGDNDGIVAILGTGSAAALYESGQIQERIPSLGFILGDEGSGFALGKALLNAIFKRRMPKTVREQFFSEFNITEGELLSKVYQTEAPAKFIASFAPFLLKNIENEHILELAENEFQRFFVNNIIPIGKANKYPIGIAGSIAYNFNPVIKQVASKLGLNVSNILKKPIEALENYYLSR